MFALLCGKPPFESKDVKSTYRRILDNNYSFPENCNVSDNSKDIIRSLLRTKPDERMSLDAILSHSALDYRRTFIPESLPVSALRQVPVWTNLLRENASSKSLSSHSSKSKSSAHFKALQSHSASNKSEISKPLVRRAFSSYDMNRVVDAVETSTKGKTSNNKGSVKKAVSVARSSSSPSSSTAPTMASHYNILSDQNQRNSAARSHSRTRRKPSYSSSAAFEIYNDGKENPSPEQDIDDDEQREDCQPSASRYSKYICAPPLRSSSSSSGSSTLLRRLSSNDEYRSDINDVTSKTAGMSLNDERREETERSGSSKAKAKQQRSSFSSTMLMSMSARSKCKSKSQVRQLVPPSIETETNTCTDVTNTCNDPPPRRSAVLSKSKSSSSCFAADVDIEVHLLESMHMRLVRAEKIRSGEVVSNMSPQPKRSSTAKATKWVSRYVDYTSKYGLGFLLNDGSSGVSFNDSTKAVLSPDNDNFNYIERRRSHQNHVTPDHHTLSNKNYPEALEKKVLLLKHFRNYLMEQQKRSDNDNATDSKEEDCDTDEHEHEDLVYVKKWVRTRHAILFRLSDRTVQVVFFDHTEIILSAGARLVTYVDKMHNRTTFPLNSIAAGDIDFEEQPELKHNANFNAEITKRLRYAKDIMHQLITSPSNGTSTPASSESDSHAISDSHPSSAGQSQNFRQAMA